MQYAKQFHTTFESLSRRYGHHRVFDDFVAMTSIALCQSARRGIGLPQNEQEEQTFLEIERRYGRDEIQGPFADLFAATLHGLEQEKGDWLGKIYSELKLGNAALGQFFTPFHVAKMMGSITCGDKEEIQQTINRAGYLTVSEPTCGSGVMVIALAEVFRETGFDPATQLFVVAQDICSTMAGICHIQLSLYGIPALVRCQNSLTEESLWGRYTPVYYWLGWPFRLSRQRKKSENEPLVNDRNPPPAAIPKSTGVSGQKQYPHRQSLLFGDTL